jgi:hypothetical protein
MNDSSERTCDELTELVGTIDLHKPQRQLEAEGWRRYAANEVCLEYRRFLVLRLMFPSEDFVPSPFIARFWMQHILNTEDYQRDSTQLFGGYLHHTPDLRCRAKRDPSRVRAVDLYRATFPNGSPRYWLANDFNELESVSA